MSAAPAVRAVRRAAPRPAGTPQLRVVAPPARSWGFAVYVAACLSLLLGGSVVVLWLNTALAKGAFEIHEMNAQLANYQTLKESTEEGLAALSEPAALGAMATELGMVPSHATGYIVLKDGTVIGLAPPAGLEAPPAQTDGTESE